MEDEATVEEGCGRDMGGVLLRKKKKYQEVQRAAWTGAGPSASDVLD